MNKPQTDLIEIVEIDGKGRGVRATADIKRGTLLVSEEPIATRPQSEGLVCVSDPKQRAKEVAAELRKLSTERLLQILDFTNAYPELTPFDGTLRTNCVPMPEEGKFGLFLTVSRFNHSCAPNAQYFWDDEIKREVVHATCNIPAGAEICVSYLGSAAEAPYAERQATLRRRYKFNCYCATCSLLPGDLEDSDLHRQELYDIRQRTPKLLRTDPQRGISDIRTAIELIKLECLPHLLQEACYDAFQLCAAWGDHRHAVEWAKKAAEASEMTKGPGNVEARRYRGLSADPTTHRLWQVMGRKFVS